jgi:phospholipid/cholesterol/gamma-HCH transport system substrate-binding protein
MRGISTELKVGVFALFVFAILGFMTFRSGGLEWAKTRGYMVNIFFNATTGLDEKTKVKVAGIDAGVIEGIDLIKGRARVRLRLDKHVVIYKNAKASIKSSGLMGDKFLSISIGTSDLPVLKDGDTIEEVTEVVDMDDLARNFMNFADNFSSLTKSLNEVLGSEESKESLKQMIVNLKDITENLHRAIGVNDVKLRNTLDNIANLSGSLSRLVDKNGDKITSTVSNINDFSGTLKTSGNDLIADLNKAVKEFKAMVDENRPAVKNAVQSIDSITGKIDSITGRIDRGEGSIGKLVKDDRLYDSISKAADGLNKTFSAVDRFRTFITFQADYLTKPKDARGQLYVTLQPSPDKYYILGVVADPLGRSIKKETITTPPGTSIQEDVISKKVEFTAQFARRFGDTALRLGVTQNTFGAGGDYFTNNDKIKLSADVWDFAKNEESATRPHVKVGLDYFLFKDIFVSAGIDNILNKKSRGGYVGVGVRFEDEDLKYLLGTIPIPK